jgi:hypothetical protein
MMSGPAVTLNIQKEAMEFSLDLVPVLLFGKNRLPKEPLRQLTSLQHPISEQLVIYS